MIRIDTNTKSVQKEEERLLNERPMGCQHRVMLTRADEKMANQYIGDIYEYVTMSDDGDVVSHDVILSVHAAKIAAVHVSIDLEDMDNGDPHKAALDIATRFMSDALHSIGACPTVVNNKEMFDEERFDVAHICLVRVPMTSEVTESLKTLRNS